jgi:D-amino-acid oxidase
MRVEKEILNGQKVVHAYGPSGGGYIFSWGLAREVCDMVNDFHFKPETSAPRALLLAKI